MIKKITKKYSSKQFRFFLFYLTTSSALTQYRHSGFAYSHIVITKNELKLGASITSGFGDLRPAAAIRVCVKGGICP